MSAAPPVSAQPLGFIPAPTTALAPPPHYNKDAGTRHGMAYVRLGNTGAVVSRVCLGVMLLAHLKPEDTPMLPFLRGQEEGEAIVRQALDAGVTFFDTAEAYSNGRSEKFLGLALQKLLPQSRFTRDDVFIATKCMPTRAVLEEPSFTPLQRGLSRKALFSALEGSLQRLQLEYVDLYIVHRYDPNTAVEETMKALHDLVQLGKVRYIGASSMFTWQFARLQRCAAEHGWTQFVTMQNHHNAIYREEERDMIPYCVDTGVACTPWSPLAAGILARVQDAEPSLRVKSDPFQKQRYHKSGDEAVVANVREVAGKRGVPPAQVALAWLMQKQGVACPVVGATKPQHIDDAVKATQLKLTEDEVKLIEAAYTPHAVTGHV